MRWFCLVSACLLGAARMNAQVWTPDLLRPSHDWLGVDAGMASAGASSVNLGGTAAAFRAEIGAMVGSHTVLMVDGLFLRPLEHPDEGLCVPVTVEGQPTGCMETPPELTLNGISGSLGRAWGQAGNTPRVIVSLGAGGYGGSTHMSLLGLDAGVRGVLANWRHASLTVSAEALLLPDVAGTRVWIVPITIGLRRH
jgi:hypothetical protein